MRHSTMEQTKVLTDNLGAELNQLALQPREHWLNGREPKIPYLVCLRKNIRRAMARPFQMLLSLAFSDLDDGAPVAAVLQPFEAAMAMIREYAGRKQRASGLPFAVRLQAITQRETRAEGKMTALQLQVAADPMNLEARLNLRTASREYRTVLDDLDALLDEGIAAAQLERVTA